MSTQRLLTHAWAAALLIAFGASFPAMGQQCPTSSNVIVIEQLPFVVDSGTNCDLQEGGLSLDTYSSKACLLSGVKYEHTDAVYKLKLHKGNEVSFLLTPLSENNDDAPGLKKPDLVLALLSCNKDNKLECISSSADFFGPDAEEISAVKYAEGDYYLHIDSAEGPCGNYQLRVDGVNPLPDLRVGLNAPPSVIAGDNLIYTLTVGNSGQLDADDVRVTLFLPPNDVSIESAGGCEKSGKTVVCRAEHLPIGASKDWSIVVQVDAGARKSIESSVDAIAQQGDPTPNRAEARTIVSTDVHLSLKLTAPAAVVAGRALTYNLTVVNEGKSEAKNVTITTTLPDEVTIASASLGCDRNTGICKFPKLAPKGSISSVIGVDVKPSARGSLLSTAIARAEEFPSGSPAEWSTQINPRANLHFTAGTTEASVIAGNILTYNFTVENAGPSTSTGASITDELPAGLIFQPSEGCTFTDDLVTCTLGTLNPHEDRPVMIKTLVDPALEETTLVNRATIVPNEDDPVRENHANESDVISTVVTISADLQLTGAGPTTVSGDALEGLVCAGENLLYTFNVFNDGPSNSRGGTIRGIALGDLSFVSSPDGCIFHGNNGTVSCPVPAMPPKGDAYVARFVAASTKALTTVPIAARVLSAYDGESGNDEVTLDSLSIDSASDLEVTLSGPSLIKQGSALTYTLEVANQGPSKAEDVQIDFVVATATPPISVVSEPSCGDTCTESSCLCSIDAGETQRITISFLAPADLGTTVTASTSVAAADCDPSVNNEDNLSTLVVGDDSDLALTLRADRDVAVEGDLLRYTIDVVNQGFEIAPRVTVIDDLPAGVTFVKVEPAEGCNEDGGTVTCEIEAGTSLTVTVRVNDGATLENKAHLVGTPDLNEANNQDSLKTLVVKVAPLVLPFFEVSDSPSGLTTLFSVKNTSTSLRVGYTAFFGSDSLFASSDLDDKKTKTVNLIDFGRLQGKRGYVGITPDPNSDGLRHTLSGDFVWSAPLHGSASGERLISTDTSRTPSELCTSWSVRFFRGEPAGASTDLLFFVPGNSNSTEPVAMGKVFNESGAFVQNIEAKSAEEAFRISINTRKDSDLPSLLAGSGSIEWTFRDGLAGHVTAAHRLRGKDDVAIPGFCRTSQTEGTSSLILPFFEKSAGITSLLAFRNETDEEIQVQTSYFDETGASAQSQPPPTQLPAHATSIVTLDQAPELPEGFRGSVKVTVVPPDNPAPLLGRALSGDYIRGDEHGGVSGSALVDAESSNQLCQKWDVRFVQGIPAGSETRFLFYLQGSGSPTGIAYKEDGGSLGSVLIPFQRQSFLVSASDLGLSGSGSVEWDLGMKGHVATLLTGQGPRGRYSMLIPGACLDKEPPPEN